MEIILDPPDEKCQSDSNEANKGDPTMEKTGWQREVGEALTARYCGKVIEGVVADKRVAYGGYVKIYLDVPKGFDLNGETRYNCIVTEKDIV